MAGGAGGASLTNGGAGFGGGGGSGIVDTGVNLTNANSFSITGGNGGSGGDDAIADQGRSGGAGGAGVTGSSFTLTNSGLIQGGAGVVGYNLHIVNSGGINSLELQAGSTISGNVVAFSGSDTLILGGGTDAGFDVSNIGIQYQNFANFEKSGLSTWTLSGSTEAATPWTISGGTLQISEDDNLGASLGRVTLDGGTLQTTADITTGRDFAITGSGGTIETDPTTAYTVTGVIADAVTGVPGALTKAGDGTLILTGANTYTGGTTILAGTLQIIDDANLGASSGQVTLDGGTLQTMADITTGRDFAITGSGGTIDTAAAYTVKGVIADAVTGTPGALTKAGDGTLILTGENTYTGITTISAGTLQLGNGNLTGSIVGDVANNGTLAFDRSNTMTFGGAISGSGAVNQIGTGTTILTGVNTYTGGTTVSLGTLQLADTATTSTANLGTGAVNIASGATLAAGTNGTFTFANELTGSGTLNASNSGESSNFGATATVGTAFTGTVALSNNTFALSGDNTAAVTNAALSLSAGNVTTVGAGNQTVGSLAFDGGTLVFDTSIPGATGANGTVTTTGDLTLNSGEVRVNATSTFDNTPPLPSTQSSILEQDDSGILVQLIHSQGTVSGLGDNLTLADQDGNPITNPNEVDINQSGTKAAVGTYDYHLSTGTGNDGLYMAYGLTQVELMLSNSTNDYTGKTFVTSGTLKMAGDNVLGQTSNLAVSSGAAFDSNGFDQSVGALNTEAGASV
ncbi:MAG: autotransporter-associated beta strand repeat-containing protein [Desulfobulbus sp.]|nr:autotransporter-associated beta strand repeat-containing protein [Desulfobulbus sp.]